MYFYFELPEMFSAVLLFVSKLFGCFHNKAQYRFKKQAMNKTLSLCAAELHTASGDDLKEYSTEIYLLTIKHSLPVGLKCGSE